MGSEVALGTLTTHCPREDAQQGSRERCGRGRSAALAEGKAGSGGITQDSSGPRPLRVETWGLEMRLGGRNHQLGVLWQFPSTEDLKATLLNSDGQVGGLDPRVGHTGSVETQGSRVQRGWKEGGKATGATTLGALL